MSMISRYFLLFLLAAGLLCCPAALSLPSLVPAALADDAGDLREVQAAINAADYGKAVGLLKPLADAGNAEALYVLGRLTLDGKGVKKNEQRAALFFRQAAEKGDRGLAELLGGIEYIRIVSLDKGDGAQFVADAERLAADPDLEFQLVMSGTEEGQTTKFYIREASVTDNSELLMLTCGAKETVVVNIYGEFDLKQVARLSSIRPQ